MHHIISTQVPHLRGVGFQSPQPWKEPHVYISLICTANIGPTSSCPPLPRPLNSSRQDFTATFHITTAWCYYIKR
ncbi:hypothetical protein Hdeb2414_s0021g00579251 [Helianthus debilis subsp. tardiflorus]